MFRRLTGVLVAGAMLAALLPGSVAAVDPVERTTAPLPDSVADLRLDQPLELSGPEVEAKIAATVLRGTGPQEVVVRLTAPAAVTRVDAGVAEQKAAYRAARTQQARVIATAKRFDRNVVVLGRTGKASNVVMLETDAKTLRRLAADPAVDAIVPVKDYTRDLTATVPYVGGAAVQRSGWKGQGVDIAILDSGIDYTHKALGGAGTIAAYKAAYGAATDDPKNTTPNGFPTARVKGGYDFVGESWPTGDLAPDPDPIDSPDAGTALGVAMGTDGGHGTHVADIIGGTKGMAPRANLYAVKVCSSISTACSGVALMHGMDWAMDPNGDGSLADHVDIINMSLGSDYGTVHDDDLSLAVERATSYAGILTVSSSGNGADRPYVTGTPGAAMSALSVAQTQVPGAKAFPLVINAPASIAGTYPNTETVEWAPLGSGFTGNIAFVGQGCPADSIEPGSPEDAYLADPAGKVALIDRGGCAISLKVDRAAKAGAVAVLLGLTAPGDAVSFSFGGGDTFVPTMIIQQSLATAIKGALATPATVKATVSSAVSVKLVGSMAGTSSRGPNSANRIKPEIGAPGASVSAISGSGTATQAFGGTSGAAPMVTGAAAQLKSAFPKRTPLEIKAVLMNTAETTVYTNPATRPGVLAPITRIGGGELRVNRALAAKIAVWHASSKSAALSFGLVDATTKTTLTRTLTIKNYTAKKLTYKVKPVFRYSNDRTNGAVKITTPTTVVLKPRQTKRIVVTMTIDPTKLRAWTLDGGANGINPAALDLLEYDGYINFDHIGTKADDADPIHVAWQVLPRKAGDIRASTTSVKPVAGVGSLTLRNVGAGAGAIDVYSLVGTSPNKPMARTGMNAPVIDLKAVGVQTFGVPADFCGPTDSFVYRIALSTWERQTSAVVPGEIDVDIDVNSDGTPDFNVFAGPSSLGALSDARAVTWVYDYDAETIDAWWYAEHGTNDSNTILTFCADQLGLDAAAYGTPWTMDVLAFDWYYRDYALTDSITGIDVAPGAERYAGFVDTPDGDVAPGTTAAMDIADWDVLDPYPYDSNPSETGLLLVTNAARADFVGGAPIGRDSILLNVLKP